MGSAQGEALGTVEIMPMERDGLRHHGEWAGVRRMRLLRIPFERLLQVLAERPELGLLVYRNACTFFAKHIRRMALALNYRYL